MIDRRFRITFQDGNYAKAVADKALADAWVVESGILAHPDVTGQIYPPDHPRSPWDRRHVPGELLPLMEWVTVLELICESEEGLALLLGAGLPGDATMVEVKEKPKRLAWEAGPLARGRAERRFS